MIPYVVESLPVLQAALFLLVVGSLGLFGAIVVAIIAEVRR